VITTTTPVEVIVGVDTHKDVHAAIAISTLGVPLSATTIPASSKGCQTLETWATSKADPRLVRIDTR
jgi:transposase